MKENFITEVTKSEQLRRRTILMYPQQVDNLIESLKQKYVQVHPDAAETIEACFDKEATAIKQNNELLTKFINHQEKGD